MSELNVSGNPFEILEQKLDQIQKEVREITNQEKYYRVEKPVFIEEASEITGISVSYLRKMISQSSNFKDCVPFHKRLGRVYFFPSELQKWTKGQLNVSND